MSGYTPELHTARTFAGDDGQIIFRHVRPHEMWHSQMFSPAHGAHAGEAENMIHHTNGGGWVPHYENPAGIAPVGNMLSPQASTTENTKIGQALRNFYGKEYLNFSKADDTPKNGSLKKSTVSFSKQAALAMKPKASHGQRIKVA
jgi:hypothetical protein